MTDDPATSAAARRTRDDRAMPTLPSYIPSSGQPDLDQLVAVCEQRGAVMSLGPEISGPPMRWSIDVQVYPRDGGVGLTSEAEARRVLADMALDLMREAEDLGWIVDQDSDLRLQVESQRFATPEAPNGQRLWGCRVRLVVKRRNA